MTTSGDYSPLGAVVLCGGRSSRMGYPKALLPFGEETLLARTVRRLASVAAPIVVVAAASQSLPPLAGDVLLARDEAPERGPLEGLRAGLAQLQGVVEAAAVASCDAPLLEPRLFVRLAELLGDADIAVPDDGRYAHVLAAVYRPRVLPAIERLLAAERLRPVYLFDEAPTVRVPIDALRDVDPPLASFRNLNRPDDYLSLLAELGLPPPPAEVRAELAGGASSDAP